MIGLEVGGDQLGRFEALGGVGVSAMDLGIQFVSRWEPSGPERRALVWRIEVTCEPPGGAE